MASLATRVAARWLGREAALSPPPRTIGPIIEWVQSMAAGYVWSWAEMAAGFQRDVGKDTKSYDKLIKAAKRYTTKPTPLDAKNEIKKFKLDLSGWRYPVPAELPDEIAAKVAFSGSAPFGAARWMSFGNDDGSAPVKGMPIVGFMEVFALKIKLQEAQTPRDLAKMMDRMATAIEHESRHLAQDLLMWATGKEQAGLPPGAKTRGPAVNPFEDPEGYFLSPHEFHPMVDSIIREFKLKMKNVPHARRPAKLKRLMDGEPMLKALRSKKPDWWRRAIREITKQLT